MHATKLVMYVCIDFSVLAITKNTRLLCGDVTSTGNAEEKATRQTKMSRRKTREVVTSNAMPEFSLKPDKQ